MEMLGQTLEESGAIGLAKVDRDISAEDNVKGAEPGKGFQVRSAQSAVLPSNRGANPDQEPGIGGADRVAQL